MAVSRSKKEQTVAEITQLLGDSKLTVVAKYAGTSVKSMQALKRASKSADVVVKVAKNRLLVKAISTLERLKNSDTSQLKGPLMYVFSSQDELAPAKVLADFAKAEPQIEFVGAYAESGNFIGADEVKALAALPGKDQLRAQLIGVFSAPTSSFVSVLSANLRGVINVLNARSEAVK